MRVNKATKKCKTNKKIVWDVWQFIIWNQERAHIIKKAAKSKWIYYLKHKDIIQLNYLYSALHSLICGFKPKDDVLGAIEEYDPGFMYPLKSDNFNALKGTVRIEIR